MLPFLITSSLVRCLFSDLFNCEIASLVRNLICENNYTFNCFNLVVDHVYIKYALEEHEVEFIESKVRGME